jgi:membrane protease YdiL (CAAX protease family)
MNDTRRRLGFVLFLVLCELGLAGVAWLIGWCLEIAPLSQFSWNAADALLGVAACIPLLAVFLFLMWFPIGALSSFKRALDEIIRPIFGGCALWELAALSLTAGVGEEILFRGALQQAFSRWVGPWVGLVIASVLFGALHPFSWGYVLMASFFGLYLGACWIASANLLVPATAHGLYDFLALAYLLRVHAAARKADSTNGES